MTQAQAVFLQGNELPARWAGRDRFVVLETGFGLGHNFLATWQAWRDDPHAASACTSSRSNSTRPPARPGARAPPCVPLADRAAALSSLAAADAQPAWPELRAGRGSVAALPRRRSFWLPELDAAVDAFYLDGFAPARNPQMWEPRLLKRLRPAGGAGRDARHLVCGARSCARDYTAAGFEVRQGRRYGWQT